MNELHATVTRHLKTQRESAEAEKLWHELWGSYEKGGAEGVNEILEKLVELPETEESEEES
jgi:hypothetical protein